VAKEADEDSSLKNPTLSEISSKAILASFWRRLGAFVIDAAIILGAYSVISPFVYIGGWFLSSFGWGTSFLFSLVVPFLLLIIYSTVSIGSWGRTAGKAALGIKVVRLDGSRVSHSLAFFRTLVYCLNFFTLGFSFLLILWTKKKRGFHDFLCNTIVIKVRV